MRLKPWGVIPKFGRVTIELPFGFMLRAGSTVATEQMNFGDFNAIYVSSQVRGLAVLCTRCKLGPLLHSQ